MPEVTHERTRQLGAIGLFILAGSVAGWAGWNVWRSDHIGYSAILSAILAGLCVFGAANLLAQRGSHVERRTGIYIRLAIATAVAVLLYLSYRLGVAA